MKSGMPSSMSSRNIHEGGGVSALRQIRTDESDLIYRGAGGGSTNNFNNNGCGGGGSGNGGSSTGTRSTMRAGASSSDALIASSQNNIEIIVDSSLMSSGRNASIDNEKGDDVEQGHKKVKHRHRPLFRRFLTYLKNAFSGTSTAVGK